MHAPSSIAFIKTQTSASPDRDPPKVALCRSASTEIVVCPYYLLCSCKLVPYTRPPSLWQFIKNIVWSTVLKVCASRSSGSLGSTLFLYDYLFFQVAPVQFKHEIIMMDNSSTWTALYSLWCLMEGRGFGYKFETHLRYLQALKLRAPYFSSLNLLSFTSARVVRPPCGPIMLLRWKDSACRGPEGSWCWAQGGGGGSLNVGFFPSRFPRDSLLLGSALPLHACSNYQDSMWRREVLPSRSVRVRGGDRN